jgi:hypothetical protein
MSCSRFAVATVAFVAAVAALPGCAASSSARAPAPPPCASATVIDAHAAFPSSHAHTALSAADSVIRSCRRDTQATPVVFEATLQFEPSGRVRKVAIAPAGPVSDCVRSELTQLEIPKFDGAPVEVQMLVTL